MAASYPTSAKSFSAKATNDVVEASHVGDLQDEVTAIETALLTGGLAHNVIPSGTRTLGNSSTFWDKGYLTALILGAETTSGVRLDVNAGVLEVLEGDDSAYGPLKALTLEATGDITAGDQLFERGRTTSLGEWITPAFSAANFTAGGTQTWTVASGDVARYAYTLRGKTMTLQFRITSSTVGGTPHAELRIAIPGGFTAAALAVGSAVVQDNGAALATGLSYVLAGEAFVRLNRTVDGSSNWTASADQTLVWGEIEFEVS